MSAEAQASDIATAVVLYALADAVTPGPWISADEGPGDWPVYTATDAIVGAREDVPWLVSEVERLTAERDALAARVAQVESLAEEWRYKGQFGWGPWQIGEGPDPEGYVMDHCASALSDALAGPEADTTDVDVCSGDADCTSALHVHGCFADTAGPCTDPDEHQQADELTDETGEQ